MIEVTRKDICSNDHTINSEDKFDWIEFWIKCDEKELGRIKISKSFTGEQNCEIRYFQRRVMDEHYIELLESKYIHATSLLKDAALLLPLVPPNEWESEVKDCFDHILSFLEISKEQLYKKFK